MCNFKIDSEFGEIEGSMLGMHEQFVNCRGTAVILLEYLASGRLCGVEVNHRSEEEKITNFPGNQLQTFQ